MPFRLIFFPCKGEDKEGEKNKKLKAKTPAAA